MSIGQTERTLYEEMWAIGGYADHSPGEHLAPMFHDLVIREDPIWVRNRTVLDAGCGSGKGGVALKAMGFDVRLCDITDAGLIDTARSLPFSEASLYGDLSRIARAVGHPGRTRFDYVYCCDVLEHLPPQFTMLAIAQMLRVATRGLFLSISLVPDQFGVWVGEALHKTVQPFTWWRDSLRELGEVLDARDLQTAAVFFVRPR